MRAFRLYLAFVFLALGAYTLAVGSAHGWNLLPIFFRDIAALTWPGQFNADFTSFLALSGLWLAWRNEFSPLGLVLGIAGFFGGMMVLAPYLLWASLDAEGDVAKLLLGPSRARG